MLPYLGLDMIHDKGKGLSGTAKQAAQDEANSASIPVLICPTRRKLVPFPANLTIAGNINNLDLIPTITKTDYAGNGGSNWTILHGPEGTDCLSTFPNCSSWMTIVPACYPNPEQTTNRTTQEISDALDSWANGVVCPLCEITPAVIPDGLSNVFYAGEKSLDPAGYYYDLGTFAGDNLPAFVGRTG